MRTKLFIMILISAGFIFGQKNSYNIQVDSLLVGHWSFDNPDSLTEATVGLPLELVGTNVVANDSLGAAEIGVGSYYIATHGISSNGGGSDVNQYTIVMDIKIPESGFWRSLYQTNTSNSNDGDWFLDDSEHMGIKGVGYTSQEIQKDEWYRVAISVSNGNRYDYYIDGNKVLSGTPSDVDGRFSLDPTVLFFADESGEDPLISVADIKMYSRDLTDSEIKELRGFSHSIATSAPLPYLQSPTATSIYVSWTSEGLNPSVEYGLSSNLGSQTTPEMISIDTIGTIIKWYSAKLENLTPGTVYYYKAKTDSDESLVYKFKTQPANNDTTEHIRFAIYGDSRSVPTIFKQISDTLKSKAISLYGENIENNLNLIFNVGDIVADGLVLGQYMPEYFKPISSLSSTIPHMVSIGNHENESPYFYQFMKYEDFGGTEGEKYYSFRIGKVLFVSLNSNHQVRNDAQIDWLDQLLNSAQNDDTIEWIFVFNHHPGHSEMWPDGNTEYVQDRIIPTLNKYSKVDMLTYGHSHNYERGTSENGSFRIMLNGGAGSPLDRWGMYANQQNYQEIQKSFDYYCYSIVDIDIANKNCDVTTYSLGNPQNTFDNKKIDHFIRNKANEIAPTTPSIILPDSNAVELPFILGASSYSGTYSLMSSQFQITTSQGNYDSPELNVKRDFEDIYGKPQAPNYFPIDLNEGIDLTYSLITETSITGQVWARVRYRDKNLQWSDWSEEKSFIITEPNSVSNDEPVLISEYKLYNNYPNPFNPTTTIQFDLLESSDVSLNIYNSLGQLVMELENRKMNAGHYTSTFDASNLSSGIYFYKLKANSFIDIRKMVLLK
jgi:hypothetical protein